MVEIDATHSDNRSDNCSDNADEAYERLLSEVHVSWIQPESITDATQLSKLGALLDDGERDREARLPTPALRELFVVSHALVRKTLSRYAATRPDAWKFREAPHGRPEISAPMERSDLRFNLSHTAGLAACVVSRGVDVGVDVEQIGRVEDVERIAKRVFSQSERDDLLTREGDALQHRFTEYWVLKEAYSKARGMGFRLPMRDIRFRIDAAGNAEVSFAPGFGDQGEEWQLCLEAFDPGHRLAVAIRRGAGPDREISIRQCTWPA